MSGEADFATQVFVRVVDRLMQAEAEVQSRVKAEEARMPLWERLRVALEQEPEFTERLRTTGRADYLEVAVEVLERRAKG